MSYIIADNLDVTPLLVELEKNKDLWKEDTFYKTHDVPTFKEIDCITLRYANEGSYENKDSGAYELFPQVKAAVFDIMGVLQGERLGGVMINKLPPGASIPLHSDGSIDKLYYHRFHLVIESNDNVITKTDDIELKMKVGELWYFDNSTQHSIVNNGTTDRIHLVIDIKIPSVKVVAPEDTDLSGIGSIASGWEHYMADQVFVKQMPLAVKGDMVHGHSHTYEHISMLATGSVRVFRDGNFVGDYIAPCGIIIPAYEQHEFIALADNTILYCIHNTHNLEEDELEEGLVTVKHT